MGEGNCEQCRILLEKAAEAISAHAKAISDLAEGVGRSFEVSASALLERAASTTGILVEKAVERYENHRSTHELKVMTAGSGVAE